MATDTAPSDEARLQITLTRAQALAAGAVLRGYLAHQRERLGDGAADNPNFRNVRGALDAIEQSAGPLPEDERPPRRRQ
jgi:hypothetical protein